MRALALCEKHSFDALHAEAMCCLGRVQLYLGAILKARTLLQAGLPKVLEHAHVDVQGDVWYALAECEIKEKAYAKKAPDIWKDVVPTLDNFDRPISYYDRALECFTYTQHRKRMQDCNYYLALIYHQLEADPAMMAKRDHHAAECLKLQGHMNKAVMDKDDFPELWITEKHLPQ